MNCKPGDLARVIGGIESNIGAIVTVLRLAELSTLPDLWVIQPLSHALVAYRGYGPRISYSGEGQMPDQYLRPIRPSEEPDEMLRIAGAPHQRETV